MRAYCIVMRRHCCNKVLLQCVMLSVSRKCIVAQSMFIVNCDSLIAASDVIQILILADSVASNVNLDRADALIRSAGLHTMGMYSVMISIFVYCVTPRTFL
jgi:hypothetical protein